MKVIKNQLVFLTFLLVFACASEQAPSPAPGGSEAPPPAPKATYASQFSSDELPLDSAIAWTARWRVDGKAYIAGLNASTMLKAFTIPNADFKELFEEGADSIRAYMALNGQDVPHLIFVGVGEDGKDMIGDEGNVYDLSDPCPPLCDTSSVLY